MTVFWIVAILLMAAALLFILPPLAFRKDAQGKLARDEINIILFKDQLKELEVDLKTNVLTEDQFEQAKKDLERGLITDVGDKTSSSSNDADTMSTKAGKNAAIVITLFITLTSVIMYSQLGEGERGLNPKNAKPIVQAEGHQGTIEEQIRALQEHLQTNPDDLEGWTMLARSYYFLKQYQSASGAFARAVSMTQETDAQLLADYADALAMASGRMMSGKPFEMIKKALSVEPNHQKALWLAATASFQAQQYPETLKYYQTLITQFPEGSDNYNQMLRNMGEVKELMGLSTDEEVAKLKASEAVSQANAATASITGTVTLDASLQAQVDAGDTLFVYARASSGPKMPLAIVRKTASDLPFNFTLDDSTAMNPAMKLSKFTQVVVSARISKSGNAIPQPGDLQGVTGVMNVGSQGVSIVINSSVSGSVGTASPVAQAAPGQASPINSGSSHVAGTVSLGDGLSDRVSPSDTIFIFAKAAKGPRMPLAVIKKQVKDLPISFTLDDA
ncbi:MAG: c-type cytochrome biogenesis protein CcmI, partial [Thiohalomonadales bacterium]